MPTGRPASAAISRVSALAAQRLLIVSLSTAGGLGSGFYVAAAQADLRQVPGLNYVEWSLATTIESICPQLAVQTDRGDEQENLLVTCRGMVHTARAQQGVEDLPSTRALDLNEEELRNALGEVAHEETLSNRSTTRDTAQTQYGNIATRLGALRKGTAGSGASGLTLNLNGSEAIAADTLFASQALPPQSGGGAGDASDGPPSNKSWFINGGINFGDKDATTDEDGFAFEGFGITAGIDRRFDANNIAGIALGYSEIDADIDDTADESESTGYSLSLYGTHYRQNNWYFDGILSYGEIDYDTTRDISALAATINGQESASLRSALPNEISGSTDGTHMGVTIGAGKQMGSGAWSWTPYARAAYNKADIDGYSEDGSSGLELEVGSQESESIEAILGFQSAVTVGLGSGVLTQQVLVEYHHEFEDDEQNIAASYRYDNTGNQNSAFFAPTDRADSDYFVLGTGVATVYKNGRQAFLYYETTVGLKNIASHIILAGFRSEF